jgi:hypothetical protein
MFQGSQLTNTVMIYKYTLQGGTLRFLDGFVRTFHTQKVECKTISLST